MNIQLPKKVSSVLWPWRKVNLKTTFLVLWTSIYNGGYCMRILVSVFNCKNLSVEISMGLCEKCDSNASLASFLLISRDSQLKWLMISAKLAVRCFPQSVAWSSFGAPRVAGEKNIARACHAYPKFSVHDSREEFVTRHNKFYKMGHQKSDTSIYVCNNRCDYKQSFGSRLTPFRLQHISIYLKQRTANRKG